MALNLQQLKEYREAVKIAISIGENLSRRAKLNGKSTNYTGANFGGKFYVIADNENDLPGHDIYINGKPAKQVHKINSY